MDLYNEALYCNNERCNIKMHKRMLDDVYNYIYTCIFESSSHFKCVKSRSIYKPTAGCTTIFKICTESAGKFFQLGVIMEKLSMVTYLKR